MPRVLFLSTDLERGGLPLRLCRLVKQLRETGVTPIVGCLKGPGPLSDELAESGVETFACRGRSGLDVACLWRLARYVRQYDPDLIHASLFHANLAARLVGRADRARPIITSTVTIEIERPLHRIGEWATAGWSDAHVANAEAVAAHLRDDLAIPPDRIVVIRNGIDVARLERAEPIRRAEFGIPHDVPMILWVGRMDPVKDLGTFVEAVSMVARRRAVRAVLIGDGPERQRAAALASASGKGDSFLFQGWSLNAAEWLKAASCVVLTSRTEGCPNVLLEAMGCHCPVIASDIPSCRELIRDKVDGVLAPVGDAGAFAAAIQGVLNDSDAARRRADVAIERIRRDFDLGAISQAWLALYDRLLGH